MQAGLKWYRHFTNPINQRSISNYLTSSSIRYRALINDPPLRSTITQVLPMGKRKRNVYYAVRIGRRPGVYETWPETEEQVNGYPRAVHKSFATRQEAEIFANVRPHITTSSSTPPDIFLDVVPESADINVPPAVEVLGTRFEPTNVASAPIAPPELTAEQSKILDRIVSGENIFFTGPAGTGKSVLLRAIITAFKDKRSGYDHAAARRREEWAGQLLSGTQYVESGRRRGWNLAVTASTGMAAVNIGGSTLHSWAGVGLAKEPVEKLCYMIRASEQTLRRWKETDALIIDELSMISSTLLDTLSQIGQHLRHSDEPFGGIQIIASGDFYQLPPVPERSDVQRPTKDPFGRPLIQTEPPTCFAFEASCWPNLFPSSNVISLQKVFRQSQTSFISLLTRLRKGEVADSDTVLLRSCERPILYSDGVEPVSLMASKIEASNLNQRRLRELPAAIQEYNSHDATGINSKGRPNMIDEAVALLDRQTNWDKKIYLKVGALVMLLANMQDGKLVNGSTGIIHDFLPIPDAQAKGIYIPERAFSANPEFDQKWPVIDFIPPPHLAKAGAPNIRALIPKMSVTVNNADGGVEASRLQIPLMLAWGMTIHKSQGQSIDRLRVDLSRIFERGQTYVALSRATNLDTLEVKGFEPHKVMAHPKVIEWSKPLDRVDTDKDMYGGADLEDLGDYL